MIDVLPFRRLMKYSGALVFSCLILGGCGTETTEPSIVALEQNPSALVTETAKSADALVNSIGINTKLSYLQSVYGTGFNGIVKPRVIALGVRHLRDEGSNVVSDGWMQLVYGRMKELAANGIRFNLTMRPVEGQTDLTRIEQWDRFLAYAGPALENVEGLNEWDLKGRNANWATQTRTFQQALYAKVKGDSRTRNMPVFGPSMGNPNNASQVGNLSAWMDFGNTHPYPGGNEPMFSVAYHATRVSSISGTRPFVATETGYHNALLWTGGHPPITELGAARYIPRLYLEFYQAGIQRTYLAGLVDEGTDLADREMHFGLLRNNGAPKPAYAALQNMITILKDPGPSFGPGQLGFTLSGDLTNLKHLLLQKRDGTFYLALWRAVPDYDLLAKLDIPAVGKNITVTFQSPVAQTRLFSPLNSSNPYLTRSATVSVSAVVRDYPTLVEIVR